MLLYNDDLRLAHYLKEWFYRICQNPKYSEQRKEFFEWISTAEQSLIPEFEKCAATYRHWTREILNAFKYAHITNGPTEGFLCMPENMIFQYNIKMPQNTVMG